MTGSVTRTLALVGAMSLAACGSGEEELPPVVTTQRKKSVEAPPPPPVTTVDYAYNPVGKRDPFRGLIDPGPAGGGTGGTGVIECTEPLCQIALDELTVVAVVSGDSNPLAMVEDRTGVGYLVRRNTRIGLNGGKVTQIRRDCIQVTSFISGGADGKPQANKEDKCLAVDVRRADPLDLLKNKSFIP